MSEEWNSPLFAWRKSEVVNSERRDGAWAAGVCPGLCPEAASRREGRKQGACGIERTDSGRHRGSGFPYRGNRRTWREAIRGGLEGRRGLSHFFVVIRAPP